MYGIVKQPSEVRETVKSTLSMRNIANPRRTTLAHLKDADEMTTEAIAAQEGAEQPSGAELPAQTANPRRTVLVDAPTD